MQVRYNMVSCFVVREAESGKSHEFLQLLRHPDDFMGNTWQAVWGQSEGNETAVQGILRELREETALVPAELFLLDPVSVFYIAASDTLWHCVQFCARVKRTDAISLNPEHEQFRWLPESEAESHFMWHDDRRAVRLIRSQILTPGLALPFMKVWP